MSVKRSLLFIAVLLLTALPTFAACTQGDCLVGPCICLRETGDVHFSDTSCDLWSFSNGASRGSSGSSYWGNLPSGIATISQPIFGGNTGNEIELQVDVTVLPSGDPGNERLIIEVRSTGGALIETLDIIDANESSGQRQYFTEGYGDDVILQFRRGTGLNDDGSEFRIDNVAFWRCGV